MLSKRILSGKKYDQDFFGNVYNIDNKAFDNKTQLNKAVKNRR